MVPDDFQHIIVQLKFTDQVISIHGPRAIEMWDDHSTLRRYYTIDVGHPFPRNERDPHKCSAMDYVHNTPVHSAVPLALMPVVADRYNHQDILASMKKLYDEDLKRRTYSAPLLHVNKDHYEFLMKNLLA